MIGERADGHVVRVEVVDAGADDRVMAVAVSTVRTVADRSARRAQRAETVGGCSSAAMSRER